PRVGNTAPCSRGFEASRLRKGKTSPLKERSSGQKGFAAGGKYGERSRSPAVFPQQDVPPHAGLKAHFITEGTQPGQRKSIISHTQILPLTVMHTSRPAAAAGPSITTLISLPLRRTFITGTLRGALSGVSLRAESHFVSAVSRERPRAST
ncbi:hypothetical protein KUCAC02_035707, partial [Chaenocephalus aceratus]